ncbi:MAG: XdhC family protein [Bacteroidia bacterium]|nr:XdhC family protein [Bacteroidia bacterium]
MNHLFKKISEILENGEDCALCTIVTTQGSTPLKAGAKMIVTANGKIFGTIGGGDLEKKVIENALLVITIKQSEQYTHNLLQQHSMCCGGTVVVFIDFISKPNRLYVFGAGHVGRALCKVASTLNFEIFLIDDRTNELDLTNTEGIHKLPFSAKEIMLSLPFDNNTYITIMTRDHSLDREILAFCINKPHAYLGMIGSKRKVEITKKMFLSGGLCEAEDFNKVDMPMGISIRASNPEEIAISILAKLILVKNNSKPGSSKTTNSKFKHENLKPQYK